MCRGGALTYPVYGGGTRGEALVCAQPRFLFGVVVDELGGEGRPGPLGVVLLARLALPVQQVDGEPLRVVDGDLVSAARRLVQLLDGAGAWQRRRSGSTWLRQLFFFVGGGVVPRYQRWVDSPFEIGVALHDKGASQEFWLRAPLNNIDVRIRTIALEPDLVFCLLRNPHAEVWSGSALLPRGPVCRPPFFCSDAPRQRVMS